MNGQLWYVAVWCQCRLVCLGLVEGILDGNDGESEPACWMVVGTIEFQHPPVKGEHLLWKCIGVWARRSTGRFTMLAICLSTAVPFFIRWYTACVLLPFDALVYPGQTEKSKEVCKWQSLQKRKCLETNGNDMLQWKTHTIIGIRIQIASILPSPVSVWV